MGDRNLSIGGDANNSIIIIGDHNIVNQGVPALPPEEQEHLTQAYLQHVAADWSTLRLYEGDEEERGIPLTDVYVLLQARYIPPPKPSDPPRPDLPASEERLEHAGPQPPSMPPEEEKARKEHQPPPPPPPPPVPLGKALQEAAHLALLGEPGSGKSTTLQFIGLCFARREENWAQEKLLLQEARVPIFLRLPACAGELSKGGDALRRVLIEEVARRLQKSTATAEKVYEAWERDNQLLVLLDGLDEVPEQREKVREQIEAFARAPAGQNARLVVASRIAGFSALQGLKEYTLQPLEDSAHIQGYLQGWLGVLGIEGNPETEAQTLLEKMRAIPALRRVLDNPLLLRLSAEVYARQGEIARNRADLYARYVAEAWRRAERRSADPKQRETALQALEAIAWHLHSGGERVEERLLQLLQEKRLASDAEAARALLALLRQKTGLLARLEGDQHAFAHATIGEYFVARRLQRAWKQNPRRTRAFLRPRWHLPEWREPIILLVGALEADQLQTLISGLWSRCDPFERATRRSLFLAAELAVEAGHWEGLASSLRPDLLQALQDEDKGMRLVAAKALGEIGDPQVVPTLIQALQDEDMGVCEAVVEALGEIGNPQVVLALIQALPDKNRGMRRLAETLKKIGDPQAVPALIQALQDEDENVRWVAVWALTKIGAPAVPVLIQALQDEKISVRWAAEALGEIGAPAVPALIQALPNKNRWVRRAAAEALGEIGDPQAVPALVQALRDEDEDVRREAAWALGKIGASAVPALVQALQDEDRWVRRAAAEALGKIGDPQAVPALIQTLQDKNIWVRRAAAEALGEIGDPQAMPALIQTLQDEVKDVRRAVGKIGDPQAVPDLIQYFEDQGKKDVRRAAAEALGKIGAPAVPALIQALQDEDEDVRRAAAWALGQIGDRQAVPALIQALQDENEDVRRAAALSLGKIGAPAVPALLQALQDEDEDVRRAAVSVLRQIGDPQAVPPLLQALQHENKDVRRVAVWALGEIGVPAVPALIQALRNEDEDVRRPAGVALWKIGAPAVPALLQALRDEDKDNVRRAAIWTLGKIGDPQAVPALIQALQDEDKDVREAAAEALGQIGDPQAVPALIQASRDEDWLVRGAAAKALGQIGDPQAVSTLIQALGDEYENVRQKAVAALEKIFDALRPPQESKTQRKLLRVLRSWQMLWRLKKARGVSLLSAALTYRDALEVALSPWKDPLQPPPQEGRRARFQQAAQGVGLALLAGLAGLLAVLLSGAGKALGDWLAPLWAAQPFLLLLGSVLLLGALGWALQRWLGKGKWRK